MGIFMATGGAVVHAVVSTKFQAKHLLPANITFPDEYSVDFVCK